MAQIDEVITTYPSAVETEGKAERTIRSYRDSLASFRTVGRRLGFLSGKWQSAAALRPSAQWTTEPRAEAQF